MGKANREGCKGKFLESHCGSNLASLPAREMRFILEVKTKKETQSKGVLIWITTLAPGYDAATQTQTADAPAR